MAQNRSKKATVAVFADAQNVSLFRYSCDILSFANSLGDAPCLYAYHHWRSISPKKECKLQAQNWRCVDIPATTKNALDKQLMNDFEDLRRFWEPDILLLITNDGDFASMVGDYLGSGRKIIIIGHKGKVSKKLKSLPSIEIYAVEDLHRQFFLAA